MATWANGGYGSIFGNCVFIAGWFGGNGGSVVGNQAARWHSDYSKFIIDVVANWLTLVSHDKIGATEPLRIRAWHALQY